MGKERLSSGRAAPESGGAGSQARRQGYLICGAVLILAGGAWIAAFSVGYGDYAPLGGSLLGVGAGLLIKWCIRPKRNQDLRDVPPPPRWW